MTLQPLPIQTKIYHGETVSSYAHRAAISNHTTPREVELELQSRGILTSTARSADSRARAWRQLGQLHTDPFQTPTTHSDNPVHERTLCLRCCRGQPASGRLPAVGLVCLRHRRWLGQPQLDLHDYPPAMTAERRFRTLHAKRSLLYDCETMRIGLEAAAFALRFDLGMRRQRTRITDDHVLLYREQVAMAQTLTSRYFLDTACNPRVPAPARRAFVDTQVQKTLDVSRDHPNLWRAGGRIWVVVRALANELLDASLVGRKPTDHVFNLRQFSSLVDGVGGGYQMLHRSKPSGVVHDVTDPALLFDGIPERCRRLMHGA